MPANSRVVVVLAGALAALVSTPSFAQDLIAAAIDAALAPPVAAAPVVAAVVEPAAPAAEPQRWRLFRSLGNDYPEPPLLVSPLPEAVALTAGYGDRNHPILGGTRDHDGVDLAAPRGSPILAAAAGVVTFVGWEDGYGNTTRIQHASGLVTTYGHQSAFADGLAVGVEVVQGQIIGAVGSTGLATGPHLHFEISLNGETIDPLGDYFQRAAPTFVVALLR